MKNLLKKSMGIMLAAIVAMQGMTAFAANETYKDGDIELCQPSEIYVNESFDGDSLPATDAGNATWKFSGAGAVPDNGQMYLQGGVKSYAQLKAKSPLTGVGNKYVLSFDFGRDEFVDAAAYYGFSINGGKGIFFAGNAENETYSIRAGGAGAGNVTVASNIEIGQMVNVKAVITIAEAALNADITVSDASGKVLGIAENVVMAGYDATIAGFDTILLGYASDGLMIDNFRLYKYVTAPKDPEIYVNETFEDSTVANGDTELANAKWKIRNSELDDGALYIPASGDVKAYAELSLTTPLGGVGKKYVVSYDFTRLEPAGGNYVNINGKKTIASFVSNNTWDLRIADAAGTYTKVASGIAAGEMVNVKLAVAIGEAEFTTDMTVTDKSGNLLGEIKNVNMLGYSANGIEKLLVGYADSMLIDNVKVYDYGYSDAPVVPDEPEEDELTSLDVERKDQEVTAKDGDIELCKPSEIYVNEAFSGDTLPAGKTANGLATWKFNPNSYIDNGSLYLPTSGDPKTVAQATFNSPLTGVGEKYVLDYDFCYKSPITAAAVVNCFFLSGNKNAVWPQTAADGTYVLRAGGPNSSNTTFIQGNKPGDVLNIRMELTIQEAELRADITVTNTTTGTVGTLKDFSLNGYDATAKGISSFAWGYQGFDMTIDNVKFYKYCTVPKATKIVEAEIPGVPAADKYIVNESFDDLSTIANKYKDSLGNTWTCPGGTSIPLVDMTSGRRVMKLADNVLWMSIVPSSIITYNPQEGANNTYVLKFGVKNSAVVGETGVYNEFLRWVADNNGADNRVANGLVNFNEEWIRTLNNKIIQSEYQWYTIAVVFELGAEKSYATTYVLDGNKTLKGATVEAATNNIKYFRLATANNPAYIDNLQLYAAGDEIAEGEAPEISVSNVKLTSEAGDVVLANVPANTEVTVSAEVNFANEKPVAYIPQGIVAAYKKLSDGSLQLAGADFMDLVYSTYSAPLFTSDSEGGEYIVKLYSWKDMNNMVASGTAVELGK